MQEHNSEDYVNQKGYVKHDMDVLGNLAMAGISIAIGVIPLSVCNCLLWLTEWITLKYDKTWNENGNSVYYSGGFSVV